MPSSFLSLLLRPAFCGRRRRGRREGIFYPSLLDGSLLPLPLLLPPFYIFCGLKSESRSLFSPRLLHSFVVATASPLAWKSSCLCHDFPPSTLLFCAKLAVARRLIPPSPSPLRSIFQVLEVSFPPPHWVTIAFAFINPAALFLAISTALFRPALLDLDPQRLVNPSNRAPDRSPPLPSRPSRSGATPPLSSHWGQ